MEKENKTRGVKPAKPVYLSVLKLNELFRIISEHTTKNVFEPSYFTAYDFNDSDATLAISSLRFLGLLDNENRQTELMNKIQVRNEDKRKEGFEEITSKAYAKLFEIEKPYELPPDRIYDEIRAQYKTSPRIARTAVPSFLRLCELSGLKEESPQRKINGKRIKKVKPESRRGKNPSQSQPDELTMEMLSKYKIIEIVNGKSAIGIPKGSENKILLDKEARKHLDAFIEAARLYAGNIENDIPNPGTEELKEN